MVNISTSSTVKLFTMYYLWRPDLLVREAAAMNLVGCGRWKRSRVLAPTRADLKGQFTIEIAEVTVFEFRLSQRVIARSLEAA